MIYVLCSGLFLNYANWRYCHGTDSIHQQQARGITKQELKNACEQYGIKPRRNEIGDYGIVRFDVRKLHNALYHESRGGKKDGDRQREDDPWA